MTTFSEDIDHLDDRSERLQRLLKAARALGGYSSTAELAEAIGRRGLGVGPLKAMEQGRRFAENGELRAIARACGLSESFFYAPFLVPDSLGYRLRRLRESQDVNWVDLADFLEREFRERQELWPNSEPVEFVPQRVEAWEHGTALPSNTELAVICVAFEVPREVIEPSSGTNASADQLEGLYEEIGGLHEELALVSSERDRLAAQLLEAREEAAMSRRMAASAMQTAASTSAATEALTAALRNDEYERAFWGLESSEALRDYSRWRIARLEQARGSDDQELLGERRSYAIFDQLVRADAASPVLRFTPTTPKEASEALFLRASDVRLAQERVSMLRGRGATDLELHSAQVSLDRAVEREREARELLRFFEFASSETEEQSVSPMLALMAGRVLETHLRKLADEFGVDGDTETEPLEMLNTGIAMAGGYGDTARRTVSELLSTRNRVVRGDPGMSDADDVRRLVQGVRDFVVRYPE